MERALSERLIEFFTKMVGSASWGLLLVTVIPVGTYSSSGFAMNVMASRGRVRSAGVSFF